MKQIRPLLLALLLLTACGTSGQASEASSASESAPMSAPAPSSVESEPKASSRPPSEEPSDTILPKTEDEANRQRASALFSDLNERFDPSKEIYSYFTCYSNGGPVVLEIGIIDEAAVDAYLASWTGTKWDQLVKVLGSVSQARQEEFARRAEALDLGPEILSFHVRARNGPAFTETGRIFLSVTVPATRPLDDIPQKIKDLAQEMDVPEEMFVFLCNMTSDP